MKSKDKLQAELEEGHDLMEKLYQYHKWGLNSFLFKLNLAEASEVSETTPAWNRLITAVLLTAPFPGRNHGKSHVLYLNLGREQHPRIVQLLLPGYEH